MMMMTKMKKPVLRVLLVALGVLVGVSVAPACNSLGSQCSSYCERWRECIDGTVNVSTCENACENWADGNKDRETKVDKCTECLSQNEACSDTTRRCTADCLGIPVR